jgi:hypothetical protein
MSNLKGIMNPGAEITRIVSAHVNPTLFKEYRKWV